MRRVFLPFIALAILLCSCQKGGNNSNVAPEVAVPEISGADLIVGGKVSLGAAKGARISIFPVNNRKIDRQSLLGTSVTDEKGKFQVKISRKFNGEPVLIEADLTAAQVKCIVVTGCANDILLGADLAPDLHKITVKLLIPELAETNTYLIGFLSHVASEVAMQNFGGAQSTESRNLIASANSQVASRFNIIADLASSKVVDIDSPDQLLSADSAALFNTFIESALVATCLDLAESDSLSGALNLCVNQFLDRGIADRSSSPETEISGVMLLSSVIDIYEAMGLLVDRDFSLDKSEAFSLRGIALSAPLDQFGRGTPSENAQLALVDKGKAFITTIRQIASSIDLNKLVSINSLASFVNGEASISLADFGVVIDDTDLFVSKGFGQSGNALQQVGSVILDVLAEYYRDGKVTQKPIALTHSFSQGWHKIRVLDQLDACPSLQDFCPVAVDLNINLQVGSYSTTANVDFIELRDVVATIDGSLVQDGYTMRIPSITKNVEASLFKVRFENCDLENCVSYDAQGVKIAFDLLLGSGSEAFSGQISGVLDTLSALKRSLRSVDPIGQNATLETQITRFKLFKLFGLNVNASGRLIGKSGGEFFASLNVTQPKDGYADAGGLIEYIETEQFNCILNGVCFNEASSSVLSGESPNSFLGLIASVAYKAKLKGVIEPVLMRFSGYRKSAVLTDISSLKLAYPGYAMNLSGKFNGSGGITTMRASSLDGIEMSIDSKANGKRYGVVTGPGGKSVADLVDMGQWIKFTFGDSTFVSL